MIEITAEIRALIDKAAAGMELAGDEYIDPADGLIHCKKCGGQRQTVVPRFGKPGYFMPRCICQCQREAEEQRKATEERQRRMERIKRRKAQGLQDRYLYDYCIAEGKAQREAMEHALAKDEERVEVLDKMVLRLYEDMVAGRISEANFNLMLDKTQTEQAQLKERIAEGHKKLADELQLASDARQWTEAIRAYADITELDAATINRLVKEIVVHEQIDPDRTRHITIEIHFNLKPIAEAEQVTA